MERLEDMELTIKHTMCLLSAAEKHSVFGGQIQMSQELVNHNPPLLKETSYSGEFVLTEDGKFLVEQLIFIMNSIDSKWQELLCKSVNF